MNEAFYCRETDICAIIWRTSGRVRDDRKWSSALSNLLIKSSAEVSGCCLLSHSAHAVVMSY